MAGFNLNRTYRLEGTFTSERFPEQRELRVSKRIFLAQVARFFESLASGSEVGSVSCYVDNGDAVRAMATVTVSGASGAISININSMAGASYTVQGGDTNNSVAATLAGLINVSAIPMVNQHVTASAAGNVVTIVAKRYGVVGNTITLSASGTGLTISAARLQGGVEPTDTTVTV